MAKRKKAEKKKPKTWRSSERAARSAKPTSKPKRRSPRARVLPGMEQTRDTRLDRFCEIIGDARDTINTAKVEEQGAIDAALQHMQKTGQQVYIHAHVELARVPGVGEKLRVRVRKDDDGDAAVASPDTITEKDVYDAIDQSDVDEPIH